MSLFHKTLLHILPSRFKIGRDVIDTAQESQDRESLRELYTLVTKWCVYHKFLILTDTGSRYVPNITKQDMRDQLCNFVYVVNFKRLCIPSYLDDALMLLRDTAFDKTISRLCDLHLRIVTEIDPRFLNLYVNKLEYALTHLYVEEDEEDAEKPLSWSTLFSTYPYLWLLFPIQQLMRDLTPIDDIVV